MEQNPVMRLFRCCGITRAGVENALKQAQAEGCPAGRMMEQNGEIIAALQASDADTADRWCAAMNRTLGDAVFSTGADGMSQVTLRALLGLQMKLLPGDRMSARLIAPLLERLPGGEGALVPAPNTENLLETAGDNAGLAARQLRKSLEESQADLALLVQPGKFLLLCDGEQGWLCPAEKDDTALTTRALDLVRRRAQGLTLGQGARPFHIEALAKGESVIGTKYVDAKPLSASQAAIKQRQANHLFRESRRVEKPKSKAPLLLAAVAAVAVLAAVVLGVWLLLRGPGSLPDPIGYGTVDFDTAAQEWVQSARGGGTEPLALLAFPGQEGWGVVSAQEDRKPKREQAELTANSQPGISRQNATVIAPAAFSAPDREKLERFLKENSCFTWYSGSENYRYKILSVYYYDPQDGQAPFDPASIQEISGEGYRRFVVEVRARSLFDTGVNVGNEDSFLTILLGADSSGNRLAVTGRMVRMGESSSLNLATITAESDPLLTANQYARDDTDALLDRWNNWYDTRNDRPVEQQTESAAPVSSGIDVSGLASQTQSLISGANEVLDGLTDLAGSSGEAKDEVGTDSAVSSNISKLIDELLSMLTDSNNPEAPKAKDSSIASVVGGDASGQTINVTMNGEAQTMDLVTCLAMVAQNELGYNKPIEAYKAQAVAAHSWILNQGGYPNVSGKTPTDAVKEAVAGVATVLITYNDAVCFTPYCASVSTGTVSCADVWGTGRAYLQAVESPYDSQYASNWNTNGNSSGSARYSRETVQNRIRDVLGIDLSGVDPGDWFAATSTNPYGYVVQMRIGTDATGSTTCSGRWFRENLLIYQSVDGRTLRSAAFTWYYDSNLDCFIFDVYGYGHGVGMSQWGAIGYANNGWRYEEILDHYYPGTTLLNYAS